jgi:ubiquinone/menaquinone biosynthesis C-methylase UbiE
MPNPTYADLNSVWVDSWARAEVLKRIEAPTLARLGGRVDGGRVLEIGTGRRGLGARMAVELFGAAHVDAVELFPDSVALADAALADLAGRVQVVQGDATQLDARDAAYDAVFDYHALHHIDDWRGAVAETARVLKPGGRFYFSELTRRIVDARWIRAVSQHPSDRFNDAELCAALAAAGLPVDEGFVRRAGGGWVLGVARRSQRY